MKNVAWIAVIFLSTVVACNYTEGQCYYLGEDGTGAGVGGGVIVTNGAGGFGNVPPEPQGADDLPPPDCNIVKDTPCNEKCLAEYVAAAETCTGIKDDAQKRTCDDNAHSRYVSCRQTCTNQANDCKKCKLDCDAAHDTCHANCKTDACHAKCNEEYGKCLKQCGDCPH